MKTTNIKGKEYVEVHERLKYFREHFKGYSLLSDLVTNENGICIIKSKIINSEGVEVANGYAREKEGDGFINKTSHIENCETSSWGRCLANFGIGIDGSVASADEVGNAIEQQKQKPTMESIKEERKDQEQSLNKDFNIQDLFKILDKSEIDIIDFQEKYKIDENNIMYIDSSKVESMIKIYTKCKNDKISIKNYVKSIKTEIPEKKELIGLIKSLIGEQ